MEEEHEGVELRFKRLGQSQQVIILTGWGGRPVGSGRDRVGTGMVELFQLDRWDGGVIF